MSFEEKEKARVRVSYTRQSSEHGKEVEAASTQEGDAAGAQEGLCWRDPTIPTWESKIIPPGIPPKMRDLHIPPEILGGIHTSHPGS